MRLSLSLLYLHVRRYLPIEVIATPKAKYYLLTHDEDLKAYLERHEADIANDVEDFADLKELFIYLYRCQPQAL